MPPNPSYFIIGTIFGTLPLILVLYFHRKTFWNHRKIIFLTAITSMPVLLFFNEIGYRLNHYIVPSTQTVGPRILSMPLEDIFFAVICTTIIPLVTIIMYYTYQKKGVKFRDIFFKKE